MQNVRHRAACLVFLLLLSSASSRDALQRWLDNLQVKIPDQSFEADHVSIQIKNFVCTHFGIQNVTSGILANSSELELTIADIRASCHGSYKTSIPFVKGDVTAKIAAASANENALEWQVRFLDNTTIRDVVKPKGVKTTQCRLGIALKDLNFEHGVSKLINLFSHMIEDAVDKSLACNQFQDMIDEKVSSYIVKAMEWLDPYIASVVKTSKEVQPTQRLFNADNQNSALPNPLPRILTVTNQFIHDHLDVGFLPNATRCGGFAAGINGILKHHDHVSLRAPLAIQTQLPQHTNLNLRLGDWNISGLNDWKNLKAMDPIPSGFYHTKVETASSVNVSLQVELNITRPNEDTLTERFKVSFGMSYLNSAFTSELAMDEHITIGSILTGVEIRSLPCIGLRKLHLSDAFLDADIATIDIASNEEISSLSNNGITRHVDEVQSKAGDSLESEVDQFISRFCSIILVRYPAAISRSVSGLFNGPGVMYLNNYLESTLQTTTNCSSSQNHYHYVNLSHTPLRQANELIGSSLASINEFIDCSMNVAADSIRPKFGVVGVSDFGAFKELSVFDPKNETFLSSALEWGTAKRSPSLDITLDIPGVFFANAVATVDGVRLDSNASIHYDWNTFAGLELSGFLSPCAALPIEEVSFPALTGTLGNFRIFLNSSILLRGNHTVKIVFNSTDFSDFAIFMDNSTQWLVRSLADGLDWGSREAVKLADDICGEEPEDDDDETQTRSMLMILSTLFLLAQPLIMVVRSRWSENNFRSSDELNPMEEPLLPPTEDKDDIFTKRESSLMTSVGGLTQYSVPTSVVFTMALFVASNLSIGASVELISLVTIPTLYDFGLFNTAQAMLNAKIYPLFLLVVLFSGYVKRVRASFGFSRSPQSNRLWPYIKLLLMLFAWIAPPRLISFQSRGLLLTRLDALSKYSLVDTYVLVGTWPYTHSVDFDLSRSSSRSMK